MRRGGQERAILATIVVCGILSVGLTHTLAMPIRPDIKKLLQQRQDPTPEFAPARAGWHGPESAKTDRETPNPVMEKFSPAGSARAMRTSLIAAAVPDWRLVLTILALIVLLRKTRRPKPKASSSDESPADRIEPAA